MLQPAQAGRPGTFRNQPNSGAFRYKDFFEKPPPQPVRGLGGATHAAAAGGREAESRLPKLCPGSSPAARPASRPGHALSFQITLQIAGA